MINKKFRVAVVILSFSILFIIGCFIYNSNYHEKVMASPKMYAYQTYFGPPNSVIIIEDTSYKEELIDYYEKMAKGENPYLNFPLKTLPQYELLYVVEYSSDGLLAKVISYYDRKPMFGGSYTEGWVYVKTLHKDPPKK